MEVFLESVLLFLDKTSKFDGTLDIIRIEKIISAPIWAC